MTCDFRTQSWNPGHPSALVLPSPLIYNQTSKSQEPVLLINYLLPELRVGLPGQIKSQGVVWGGEKDMRSRGKPAPLSGAAPHNSCEEFHTHPGVYILGDTCPILLTPSHASKSQPHLAAFGCSNLHGGPHTCGDVPPTHLSTPVLCFNSQAILCAHVRAHINITLVQAEGL